MSPFVILPRSVQVAVPDVIGEQRTDAESQIQAAGLVVGAVGSEPNAAPVDEVINQAPLGGTLVDAGSMVNLTVSLGLPSSTFDGDYDAAEQLPGTVFARSWRTQQSVEVDTPLRTAPGGGPLPDFQSDAPGGGPRAQMYVDEISGSGVGNLGTLAMTPTGPDIWAMYCQYIPTATADSLGCDPSNQNSKWMRLDMSNGSFGTEGPCTTYGGFGDQGVGGAGELDRRINARVGGDGTVTGGWDDATSFSDRYRGYQYPDGPNAGDFDNQLSGATVCLRSDRVSQGGSGWVHPGCWLQPKDTWWRVVVHADWTNAPNGDIEIWAQVDGEPWYKVLDGRQGQPYPWYWAGSAAEKVDEARCFVNLSGHSGEQSHPTYTISFKNFWVGTQQPVAGLP